MTEQNWDKDTTLKHLIRKAGYGKNWKDVVEKIELQTYESSITSITFQEYEAYKNNSK